MRTRVVGMVKIKETILPLQAQENIAFHAPNSRLCFAIFVPALHCIFNFTEFWEVVKTIFSCRRQAARLVQSLELLVYLHTFIPCYHLDLG